MRARIPVVADHAGFALQDRLRLRPAALARRHDDADVPVLPARVVDEAGAVRILETFLATPFDGGRHGRRVATIDGAAAAAGAADPNSAGAP